MERHRLQFSLPFLSIRCDWPLCLHKRLLSAKDGSNFRPIAEVSSNGEMSRVSQWSAAALTRSLSSQRSDVAIAAKALAARHARCAVVPDTFLERLIFKGTSFWTVVTGASAPNRTDARIAAAKALPRLQENVPARCAKKNRLIFFLHLRSGHLKRVLLRGCAHHFQLHSS